MNTTLSSVIIGSLLASAALDYQQDELEIFYAFSLAIIFAVGWLTALATLGIGRHLHRQRIVALGSIGLGVMTIATSLGTYISLLVQRGGVLEATVFDFAMVSALGLIGGIIATVAFLRIWVKASVDEAS